jgi:hypothetical protein
VLLALLVLAAWPPRAAAVSGYAAELASEERLYNRYAVPWALGQGTEPREKAFPWHPLGSVTHRPPGYVLFVGLVYRLAGVEHFAAVRWAQVALDIGSVLLVYAAGLLLFGGLAGRAVGFLAGLATAGDDFLYLHVARLLSETLYIWLGLLFLVLALFAARRRSWGLAFLAAYVLGWANLVRPFLVFAIPAFVLWLPLVPGLDRRQRLGLAAAAVLGSALAILPVTWRNWQFHGQLIPISSNSGFTLWKSVSEVPGLSAPAELLSEEAVDARGLGELAEQDAFRALALDYLAAHPEDWARIYGRKVEILLAAKGGHRVSHELMVTPVDEWLYPLLIWGALLSIVVRPRRSWHGRLLVWAMIASQVLVCLLANAEARYRVPLLPLLALLAAWALWGLGELAWERLRPSARPAPSGAA